jgi:hypothetical protein
MRPRNKAVDKPKLDNLVRDLVRLLQALMGMHAEVALHMRTKLEAIKRADTDAIQSITAREMLLAGRLQEREGLRKQLMDRLGECLGLEKGRGRKVRLAELAEMLPEPQRSQLLVSAAGLREKVSEIDRLRTRTTAITQEMLKHLRAILAVMTQGGASDVYSRSGRRERLGSANVFEAVG